MQGGVAQLIVSSLHGVSSADITSHVCEVPVVRTRSVVGEWQCCYNPEDGGIVPTKRWCLSVKQRGVTFSLVVCSDRQRVNPVSYIVSCCLFRLAALEPSQLHCLLLSVQTGNA